MSTIDETRHANFLLLSARYPTLQAFANAVGRSHSQMSQIKTRARHSTTGLPRSIGDDLARDIETRLGLNVGWLDVPHVEEPPQAWGAIPLRATVRSPSHSPEINWGEVLTNESPPVFCATVPDDAMAPRVRRGDVVRFTRGLQPRPGDGVLVVDDGGAWFFRLYRERRPGEWEAAALNEAYQAMDAGAHGLRVEAVLTGIEQQRWG